MSAHFKTEAEFQRWLDKTPAARARLQLATSNGEPVVLSPPADDPSVCTGGRGFDTGPAITKTVTSARDAGRAAPHAPARWRHVARQAAVWFFVTVTGVSALGLWTCFALELGRRIALGDLDVNKPHDDENDINHWPLCERIVLSAIILGFAIMWVGFALHKGGWWL